MDEDFHRCMDAQAALEAAEIVVGNILPDHPAQLLPAGEFPTIVPLPLEDAPEALHRPVVNTFAHPGHTLCHLGCGQLIVEHLGRILKAPVAVEQWVRIRIGSQNLIQCLVDQGAVVGVPEGKGNDPLQQNFYDDDTPLPSPTQGSRSAARIFPRWPWRCPGRTGIPPLPFAGSPHGMSVSGRFHSQRALKHPPPYTG